jgi:hypothetical protein
LSTRESRPQGAAPETATKQSAAILNPDTVTWPEDTVTWREVLDHIDQAFGCGYDLGYAHGRNDRLGDDDHARRHDLACRTIGLRPHSGSPLLAVAS